VKFSKKFLLGGEGWRVGVLSLGGYARLYIEDDDQERSSALEKKIAPQRKSWIRLCPHNMVV